MIPTSLAATLTFRAADLWPISLLALALLGLAIVIFYGPQARALSRPWQWLLPLLRGVALVVMSVSILRPVLSVQKPLDEQGAVLVLLDRSRSMAVTDRTLSAVDAEAAAPEERRRLLSELVSLAEAAELIPADRRRLPAAGGAGESAAKLAALADEIRRARREIEYARLSGRSSADAQQRLELVVSTFTAAARAAADDAAVRGARRDDIEQLQRLATHPKGDGREWFASLPGAIEALRRDSALSQQAFDEQLYRSDPEVKQACDQLARMSRAQLASLLLWRGERSLLGRLGTTTPVSAFAIGGQVTRLDASPSYLQEGEPNDAVSSAADALSSDLTGGLRRALQQSQRQMLQAVVLVSDGRQVGSPPALPAGLLPSGVPIFPVYAASDDVRDLAIRHVEIPDSVFIGEQLTVGVDVHGTYPDAAKLTGRATAEASSGESAQAPLLARDRRIEPLELKLTLRKPGLQRVTISLPVQEGEATTANNRVERWVKVLSQRLRVLAVSGSPGWDYRYMRNALSRAPFIDLREALIIPGSSVLAMSPREILEQDVVILADIARDALSLNQWDAVGRLVQERGGSVILVSGVTHLRQQWSDHVMADLLPYDPRATRPIWRVWPGEKPYYRAVPARDGERLRALQLDHSLEVSRRRWEELPEFYQYMAIAELKPAASVLMVERESRAPLLMEQRVGPGRVLFFGMNETWRWRYMRGSQVQDRFWLQLVRHAADEPYALVSSRLSADVDRVSVNPGEPIRLRARLAQRPGEPLPQRLNFHVMQADEYLRSGTLEAVGSASSGRYAAVVADLAPGEYDMIVSGPQEDGMPNDIPISVKVEPSAEAELADITGDRAFLRRLADATGGRCLDLAEVPSLPAVLAEARQRQPRIRELSLWDSPLLFVFVLSCLAAEWALRKRVGLA